MVLLIIGMVLAVFIATVLGLAAARPDVMRIERSATLRAAPGAIFAHLNDFQLWNAWSPWEKLDPAMRKTFSGAALGLGAVYEWEGNSKAGKGRMEVTESEAPSKVVIQLDVLKPFKASNVTAFTLAQKGDSTELTWAMSGRSPFMAKVMGLFINMDKLVGKDFERGLENLRSVVEK